MKERSLVLGVSTLVLSVLSLFGAEAPPNVTFGEATPFTYEGLIAQAKQQATQPFKEVIQPDASLVQQIDFLQHGRIHFKQESVLWIGSKKQFAISFFHVGKYFRDPVKINLIEDGKSREVVVSRDAFEIPADHPAAQMKSLDRVAGFKIQEDKNGSLDWKTNDWVSFLGASYFRTIGQLYQYGLSSRGLAVNPANPNPPFNEEFPKFTSFWFESPEKGETITIYTLLDGPSVTGAYRFVIDRKKQVIMDVDANIFLRTDVARLCFSPLTSMYWFSETAKPAIIDWRPEVHDSDGLAMWKGNGEVLWRPLNNPTRVAISSFSDENPKGFGLMQRDRDWRSYVEDGAYERRPSLWVEPKGDWGKGAVQLLELPTQDESQDNIVAFWVPDAPAKAKSEYHMQYRLTWGDEEPVPSPFAKVVATRIVREPMKPEWPKNRQKFIVEFEGGPLKDLPADAKPDIDLWSSKGYCNETSIDTIKLDGRTIWRVKFSLWDYPKDPTELRLFLRQNGKPLTETWSYQFAP